MAVLFSIAYHSPDKLKDVLTPPPPPPVTEEMEIRTTINSHPLFRVIKMEGAIDASQ